MQFYLDTSAIVKIYHQEEGSEVVLPIYKSNDVIVISELCKVEFLSTTHKKFRNNEIDAKTLAALKEKFIADSFGRFTVIPPVSSIIDTAIDLIDKHGKSNHVFSLDAMQIAALSVISDDNTTFVCADKRLIFLVKNLGYSTLEL